MAYDKFILVVDDEEDVRNYLSTALLDAGFEVDTAYDGMNALEKIKQRKPDLISLDLVMPGHSGMKLFRELQKNKEYKNIPVLIVTGHAHDDLGKVDFDELMMQGPGIYLEKPVKPGNYVEKVCTLMGVEPPKMAAAKADDTGKLKSELEESLKDADTETLQKALDALKKK
ncbi:MAG: response regulator [Bacteroidota bacterium]